MSGPTFQDRRDDLELAATVRTVLHVDLEHPLEQLGPAQPHQAVMRTARLALGGWRGLRGRLSLLRHHQRTQLGIRCQNTMVRAAGVRSLRETKLRGHQANEVQPRPGHQRSQPLHELQRRRPLVGGAVAPRGLELQHDWPGSVGLYAFVGQSRAGDVAAQLLERLAVVGRAAHGSVQAASR